jgi:hypothetical protein
MLDKIVENVQSPLVKEAVEFYSQFSAYILYFDQKVQILANSFTFHFKGKNNGRGSSYFEFYYTKWESETW